MANRRQTLKQVIGVGDQKRRVVQALGGVESLTQRGLQLRHRHHSVAHRAGKHIPRETQTHSSPGSVIPSLVPTRNSPTRPLRRSLVLA